MLIKGYIRNEVYHNLIEYASNKCDAIMFVARKDGFVDKQKLELDENMNKLKLELHNSFLNKRNGSYWVFTKVGYTQLGIDIYQDSSDFDKLFQIFFYKFSDETKSYLQNNNDLYSWLNPKYPEDISFFKEGYCWLYSVAHEELCEIYCENEEEFEHLKSIGIQFIDNRFIPVEQKDLYFEEYKSN